MGITLVTSPRFQPFIPIVDSVQYLHAQTNLSVLSSALVLFCMTDIFGDKK